MKEMCRGSNIFKAKTTVKEAWGWVRRDDILFPRNTRIRGCSPKAMQRSWRVPFPPFVLYFPSSFKIVKKKKKLNSYFSPFKKTQRQTAGRCMTSQSSYTCQENTWPKGQKQCWGKATCCPGHSVSSALKSSDLWQVTKHCGTWFFKTATIFLPKMA